MLTVLGFLMGGMLEAVENGTLSMDTIDTACRRVLTWKQALGLI